MRSEYRLAPNTARRPTTAYDVCQPDTAERTALATLLLDAYRGTVDDEGEDMADALVAVDEALHHAIPKHSFVVLDDDLPIAMSFVVVVEGLHYIDPVAVSPGHKRRGIGTMAVRHSLASLADADIAEVGATITDGNVASLRLFTQLGFVRHGIWS